MATIFGEWGEACIDQEKKQSTMERQRRTQEDKDKRDEDVERKCATMLGTILCYSGV